MSELQSLIGILLNQENGGIVLAVDLADNIEDLLNNDRGQAREGSSRSSKSG